MQSSFQSLQTDKICFGNIEVFKKKNKTNQNQTKTKTENKNPTKTNKQNLTTKQKKPKTTKTEKVLCVAVKGVRVFANLAPDTSFSAHSSCFKAKSF